MIETAKPVMRRVKTFVGSLESLSELEVRKAFHLPHGSGVIVTSAGLQNGTAGPVSYCASLEGHKSHITHIADTSVASYNP